MNRSRPFVAGILLAIALEAPPARAETGEAEAALAHGIALRRERKDAEALAEFERAYALDPTPRALAQVALAEAALERWVTAEADLLRAMDANDAWIAHQQGGLRTALHEVQAHLGTLALTSNVAAEVWVDGALVARLPAAAVRVPAKHLHIELRAEGFTLAVREIDLAPASTLYESIRLEPARAAEPSEPSRAPPPPPKPSEAVDDGRAHAAAAGRPSLLGPIALGAAGVVGLGVGTYFGVRAFDQRDESRAQCAGGKCTPRAAQLYDDAKTSSTASTIAFVAGGASLAAGVAWWWIDRGRARRRGVVQALPFAVGVAGGEVTGVFLSGEL